MVVLFKDDPMRVVASTLYDMFMANGYNVMVFLELNQYKAWCVDISCEES
jgi:hypothetical protein